MRFRQNRFPRTLFAIAAAIVFQIAIPAARAGDAKSEPSIRVAIYVDSGAGRSRNQLIRALKKYPKFQVQTVKSADIIDGSLKEYDVIIHPGGSGGKQGRKLGKEGRKAVREFVRRGGGYVGFCAGAYLATNDYSWSLNILDAKVIDKKHWARGYGKVQLRMTAAGKRILGVKTDDVEIYYHQGPLLAPNHDPKTPDYQPLARFETEVKKKGVPGGVMKGKTAIASGRFGSGRVFCFSPHPEKTKGLERFVERAVAWAARKENPGGNSSARRKKESDKR